MSWIDKLGRRPAPHSLIQSIEQELNQKVLWIAQADFQDERFDSDTWLLLTSESILLVEDQSAYSVKHLGDLVGVQEHMHHGHCEAELVFTKECWKLNFSFWQRQAFGPIIGALKEFLSTGTLPYPRIDAAQAHQSSLERSLAHLQAEQSPSATLFRLLAYLRPYRVQVALGLVCAIVATIMQLIPAFASKVLLDDSIRPFMSGELSQTRAIDIAWVAIGFLALSLVIRELLNSLRLRIMSIIGEKVAGTLRDDLYRHMHRLGQDFYSKRAYGSLVGRITNDSERLWDFIAFGVVETTVSLITLAALIITLLALDWKLGIWVAIPVPMLIGAIAWHAWRMEPYFTAAHRKWSHMTTKVADVLPGMMVVQAFFQRKKELQRFDEKNQTAMDEFNLIHTKWTVFWPIVGLGLNFMTVVVWFLALPRLLSTSPDLSLGTFVSFLLYLSMFTAPVEIIGQISRIMNRALSSAHRMFEILDITPTQSETGTLRPDINGEVTLENVSFGHDPARPVLKEINLTIESGEFIGLVGPSGAGKSTVIKLLSKFYSPDHGRILIDGTPLEDISLGHFRSHLGMVLQESYLFQGSIFDNITYGSEPDFERAIRAAKMAFAHNFVRKLPRSYDTIIGERGHTLSGGERQRIAIARAIYTDPKILLLDEATSAVDTKAEREIQKAMEHLIQGRTVIAIAHRLSTLRNADRIIVIKDGRIAEQGDHYELSKKESGIYRELLEMQGHEYSDSNGSERQHSRPGEQTEALASSTLS